MGCKSEKMVFLDFKANSKGNKKAFGKSTYSTVDIAFKCG